MTWTYVGNGSQVDFERRITSDGALLVVTQIGKEPRIYNFENVAALAEFQRDMEHGLLLAGWTLSRFTPERRSGNDRRARPRLGVDRRRALSGLIRPAVEIAGGHRPRHTAQPPKSLLNP